MSLQVWLPLTKDLRNQGLSNVTVTNNGATFNSVGKLGGCYSFGNGSVSSNGLFLNSNLVDLMQEEYSVAVWVKPLGNHYHYNGTIFSSGNWNSTCYAFGLSQDNSQVDILCKGYNTYLTCAVPVNSWTHLACTCDSTNTVRLYKNGEYIGSSTRSNKPDSDNATQAAIGRETYADGYFTFNGMLNDFRLYDHCLSPMEVKELSKGLVLHYPLNRGGWGQENLLPNTNEGITGWNWTMQVGDYTRVEETTLSGVRGCKFTRGTTAQSGWSVIFYNLINENVFKASTSYTLSVDIYPSVNTYLNVSIRESNGTNVVCNNAGSQAISANKWNHMVFHLTSVATLPSSTGETVYFTDMSPAVGNSYIFRNLKLEEGSIATPWCPNSSDSLYTTMGLNSTTEYDCSGFCNNGTKWAYDSTGTISYTSNTPKYSVSTFLDSANNTTNTASGTQYIYGNCVLTTPQYLTVAFWCKPIAGYGGQTGQGQFSLTINNIGTDAGSDYQGGPMNHRDSIIDINGSNGTTHKTVSINFTANEWHHYVVVYDGRYARVYKDGVATATADMGSVMALGSMKGAVIGFSKAGGVWRSNKSYYSDFRIYATALSADDVKSLYQNSAYIDSNGNVYGAVHSEV